MNFRLLRNIQFSRIAFFLALAAVAIARFPLSANLPNRWSVTQLVCTYQDGCFKRSFVGAILWPLRHFDAGELYSFLIRISWASSLVIIVSLVSLIASNVVHARRSKFQLANKSTAAGVALLLLSIIISPSLEFFYHASGYLDSFAICTLILGYLCVAAYLRAPSIKLGVLKFIAFVPAVIAMGIHEMSAVAFLPTYLIVCFLRVGVRRDAPIRSVKYYSILALSLSVSAAVLAAVLSFFMQFFGKPSLALWLTNHQQLAKIFVPRGDFFDSTMISSSVKGALRSLSSFDGLSSLGLGLIHSLAFAFLLLISLALICNSYPRIDFSQRNSPAKVIREGQSRWLMLCIISPIAMAFLGWDFYRWGALVSITFLAAIASPQGFEVIVNDLGPHRASQKLAMTPQNSFAQYCSICIAVLSLLLISATPPGSLTARLHLGPGITSGQPGLVRD